MVETKNLLLRSRGADGKAITENALKRMPEDDDSSTTTPPQPSKRAKSTKAPSKVARAHAPSDEEDEDYDSKPAARITQDSEDGSSDDDASEESSDEDSIDKDPEVPASKGIKRRPPATAPPAKTKVPVAPTTKGNKRRPPAKAPPAKRKGKPLAKPTKPRKSKPMPKTVTPPTTEEEKKEEPPPALDKLLELTRNLQQTLQSQVKMQELLLQQQTTPHPTTTTKKDTDASDEDDSPKANKQWTTHKEAKFCAWAGVCLESDHLPDFFKHVACARADDKHGLIMSKFESLSRRFQEFVDFEPSQDLIDDIKKFTLAPVVSATKWHRGLGPMAFADRDYNELEEERAQRDRMDASPGLRLTLADIKAMESGPPPVPRSTEKALKYLQRWKIFLRETLGARSALTNTARTACTRLLQLQRRIKRAPTFVSHRLPSILWDLTNTASTFFTEIIPPEQFHDADDNDEDPPAVAAYFDASAAFSFSAGPNSDLPAYLLPQDETPNPTTPKKAPRDTSRNDRNGKDTTNKPAPNSSWHNAFRQVLQQANLDPNQVILSKWVEAANKRLSWLTTMLGLGNQDCLKFHTLGCCNVRNCTRSHTPRNLDDDKVKEALKCLQQHATPTILPRRS